MKKYFYRLLPICLFILVMTGCNDTETVISIGEARNLVAEISTQSAAIGDNVTFTVKVDQQDNQLALEEDIDVVLTFAGKNVEGKDVIIIDDMISSGDSILDVARELKRRKARKVYAAATFGLFTNGLAKFDAAYEQGIIDHILTTNLVYQRPELLSRPYYVNVDLSKYIALLIDNLNQMGTDLGSVAGTVQSLSDMTDSAITMLNTTTEFLQESGSGTKSSVSSLENSDLSSLTSLVSGTSKTISDALTQNASFYTAVSDAVDKALDSYNIDAQAASNALTSVSSRVQTVIDEYTKLSDALTAIANEHPELTILNDAVASINQKIQLAIDRQTAIRDKINAAAEALPTATANAAELKSELDTLITQATSSVTEVKTTYENNVKGNLDSLSANLDSTTGSISSMLGDLDKSIQNIAGVTGSTSDGLTGLQKTLSNSAELLNEASGKLTSLAATLSSELSLIHISEPTRP